MPSHSNSFGNNAEKDTAGCRAFYRKTIVIGEIMKISPFEMIFIIRDLMASITPIKRKRILVTKSPFRWGVTYKGNQIRSTVTWAPEPDMTKRQIEKEVKRLVYEFEREIKLGFKRMTVKLSPNMQNMS